MRSITATLFCLMLASHTQAQVSETPEQVAERFVGAMRAADWKGMASLMHPNALRQMRQFLAPLFEAPKADQIRLELLGVKTVAEAQALSDTAVFESIMRITSQQAGISEALRSATVQILGHLNEGPDTVHVVFRMALKVNGIPITRMDVMSLARSPLGWRGLLKGDISALAAQIRNAIQAQ